ncbi:UNVERIFIED_CONTAM: hypothetical protein Sradi_0065700 [Sesamum radiatum]|uniref:B box-type domain-containing protein n=1 Tax=Sesamum radiatum TaxID=300843 RepID=A0AAW2WIF6_SESRA
MKVRLCELCNAQATLFCPSDDAFLCCTCDAKVHDANFLVARHLRKTLSSSFTGDGIYGLGFQPSPPSPSTSTSTSTPSPPPPIPPFASPAPPRIAPAEGGIVGV